MYSCLSPSFSGAWSTSIFIRMSAGTSLAVNFEMKYMRPIASGSAQMAGCSARMRGVVVLQARRPRRLVGEHRAGDGHQAERAADQHARGRAFHRDAAPPRAQEEQGEVTRRRDGKGPPDHLVDLEMLDEKPEQN